MKCTSRKFITGKFSLVLSEFRPQIMHSKEVVPLLTLQSHIKYTVSLFFFKSLRSLSIFSPTSGFITILFSECKEHVYICKLCVCVCVRVRVSCALHDFLCSLNLGERTE